MVKTFSISGDATSLVVQILPPGSVKDIYLSVSSEYFYSDEMTQVLKANDQHLVKLNDLITEYINNEITREEDKSALRDMMLDWVEKLS